jgi:hypothetical protein
VAWWLLVDEWTYHALEKERECEDENVAERRKKRKMHRTYHVEIRRKMGEKKNNWKQRTLGSPAVFNNS